MFDGAKIKRLREQRGLTSQELADMTGSAQSLISAIENNTRLPNANLVENFANIFKVPISDLYKDESR